MASKKTDETEVETPTDTPKTVVLTGARTLKIGGKTYKRGQPLDVEVPPEFKRYTSEAPAK